MALGLTVDVNIPGIDRLNPQQMEHAQLQLSERWRNVCEPYVPMDTGLLRDYVEIDGANITYKPANEYGEGYAEAVYNMAGANWTTPGTTDHWDETAKALHQDEVTEFIKTVILGE